MASDPTIPEFGVRLPERDYILRRGAYVLLRDDQGRLAVVRAPSGTYLPGGGQHCGESLEETAIREVAEECGIEVEIGAFVGVADEFVHVRAEGAYFQKRANFFFATAVGTATKIEMDHELIWLPDDEARKVLSYGCQRWAILTAARGTSDS